jgi:hypothetical protein
MADALTIIKRVIEEHHKIRDNIKLAGDSLNDVEASFTLARAYSSWTQSASDQLEGRLSQLIQALSTLDTGLKAHFGYEEDYLPPLFGTLLIKALLHEHSVIRGEIDSVKKTLSDAENILQDPQELAKRRAVVQDSVNHLMQVVEEHAAHEEVVLMMIKGGLEAQT